jgi:hypothetical protein
MAGAAATGSAGEGAAAFEIDHVDHERHQGWSVLLVGRLAVGTSPREPQHGSAAPHPWALGQRTILLRLRPDRISGRRLGADWRGRDPVRRRL